MTKNLSEGSCSSSFGNNSNVDQNELVPPVSPSSDGHSNSIKSQSTSSSMKAPLTKGNAMVYNNTINSSSSIQSRRPSSIYSSVDTTSTIESSAVSSPTSPPPISGSQGLLLHSNQYHFNSNNNSNDKNSNSSNTTIVCGRGDIINSIPMSPSSLIGNKKPVYVAGLDPTEYDEDEGDGVIREDENQQEEIKRLWKNILNLFV